MPASAQKPSGRTRTALTVAGSDSCGGAGIQADLKTFARLGVHGMCVITAVTAQNTTGVRAAKEMDRRLVRVQIQALCEDLPVDATKTGMLASRGMVETVAALIREEVLRPYVCDPVVFAKSGDRLVGQGVVEAIRDLLLPLATVVTPNVREAELLAGMKEGSVSTLRSAREAARRLLGGQGTFSLSVVVKGVRRRREMLDLVVSGGEEAVLAGPLESERGTHGSGCVFSAATTAGLACGLDLWKSVDQAKRLVEAAIRHPVKLGKGRWPVNPTVRWALPPGGRKNSPLA